MTPYELAKQLHKDLSPIAPRLSAALNRALTDIGEGSLLVGLGPGTHRDDPVSFQESESFQLADAAAAHHVIAQLKTVLALLEAHSAWRVLIDKKPSAQPRELELLYTLIREPRCL